jgi:antitoxin component HigA of HigAB toxin-antitoxin module
MKHQPTSKRFFYLLTAAMTLFCSEVSANASAQDVNELDDICMYSQRILKDYALIGMGVTYHDPKKDIDDNIKTVDKYFKDIESHKLNEKLKAEVVEVEKSWNEIKPEFQNAPDKAKMSELRKKVEAYTVRCEQVAEDLAKDTGIKGEHDVVLVAELGLESQRLAALYLMKAWGVADANYEQEVSQVVDETERIYKELLAADDKLVSKEIKEKLKTTENDFIAFGVMAKSKSGRFMPSAAEENASKIFEALREILAMEKKLVEGNVSGYFIPVAGEKAILFDKFTVILQAKEEETV